MAFLKGSEREKFVRNTFAEIAPRYVFMNHLMTGGMDIVLRREMARLAHPKNGESLLDLGCGTGDLAKELQREFPATEITAADFSLEMMTATNKWLGIKRAAADALHLPFADASFDLVTSGYLVRNVIDLETALAEQFRVLKPGGRVFILDMTKPRSNVLTPFINFYLKKIIPVLGGLFNRNRTAYTYLIQSTQNFVTAENLVRAMENAGFRDVQFRIRMFGTMAIHNGTKPE